MVAPASPAAPVVPGADDEFETWARRGHDHLSAHRLPDAADCYRKAVGYREDPGVLHNLGVAVARQGLVDEALTHFRRSLDLRPDTSETLRNLGVAYGQKGDPAEAERCYRRALALDPKSAQAHLDLGNLLASRDLSDDASAHFRAAVRLNRDFGPAHHALGRLAGRKGRHGEAIPHLEEAVRCRPEAADAHHDLGVAFLEVGRHEDAADCFRRTLRFDPGSAHARSSLGAALAELGRNDEAVAAYEEALRLAPDAVEVLNNYGNSLRVMGRLAEAEARFAQALERKPGDPGMHNNLGIVYVYAGRVHEAVASYDRALDRLPDFPSAHLNRAFAWLTLGDFGRGWDEYEWRWKEKAVSAREFSQPAWDGSPLEGKPILLHAEQGLGDTLQFVRYAGLVKARGGHVILECPPPLVRLLSDAAGIDRLVPRGSPLPEFACHSPLLSLPRLFRTELATIPADGPYLHADRRRVERWRDPIRSLPGFKVGIAWQGSKGFKADRHRSAPLAAFEALAKVPGVTLVSLQKNAGAEQLAGVRGRFGVVELPAEVDRDGAFVDTAAVMRHLDLVVSVDTSMGHLAGGLGVPTWVALGAAADWRWLWGREDSPWYPGHRLFRQDRLGDWTGVFERMAAALAERVGRATPVVIPAGVPAAEVPAAAGEGDDPHGRGVTLLREGRLAEAEAALRAAAERDPNRWDTRQNLAVAVARQGRSAEAVRLFGAVADRFPESASAQGNLGLAYLESGDPAAAERSFARAARLDPGNPEAHNNLGVARLRLGRREEAVAAFRGAVGARDGYAPAHANLASTLRGLGRSAEAVPHALRALELGPATAGAHQEAGLILTDLGRLEEAEPHFRRAVEREPGSAEAHNNLAVLLADLQDLDGALAAGERAVALKPECAGTRRNRGLVRLAAGDWVGGWSDYERRWEMPGAGAGLPPRWDGSPLAGGTLLVVAEQGSGDTLHFVRYLPRARAASGGRVVFACPPSLIPLVRPSPVGAGVDEIVPLGGPLPAAAASAGLVSLPGLLGTTPETVPAFAPYLAADPGAVARWRDVLGNVGGFRVGIVWQGSPGYGGDRYRSAPLAAFAPLAGIPGVQLVSLQKGAGTDQLAASAASGFAPLDLGRQVDEGGGAFVDTAAVVANLDLVVGVDTAIGHLAGGLGVPVWLALSTCADWRWLRGRGDTPWYPGHRLFRQSRRGDWAEVFGRIAVALRERVAGRLVSVEVGAGELVDKVTILEIKRERLSDPAKLANVAAELAALAPAYAAVLAGSAEFVGLAADLKAVNEEVWEVEDGVRACERAGDFGPSFVGYARGVYHANDRRAALKRRVNALAGSRLIEEKSHAPY